MRLFVVPLALLFIALAIPSFAQSAAELTTEGAGGAVTDAGGDDDAILYVYDVGRAILLNCSSRAAPSDTVYTWSKNGTGIDQLQELKDRYELLEGGAVLRVKPRTHEDDYGRYACAAGGAPALEWRVTGRPQAKLPPNVNVVEGQKLKVTCKVIGKPYPRVQWLYSVPDSDNLTQVPVEELGGASGRVLVRDSAAGVPGGELVLEGAVRADAGNYSCAPPGGLPSHTILRVKGMYDALWPFLGICAEVFVLCAIILVYEKRRTKPELDDSDTDNHDQKKS